MLTANVAFHEMKITFILFRLFDVPEANFQLMLNFQLAIISSK